MMKKTAFLSLSAVLAAQLMAAEDLNEMIKEGKAGGYLRIHHIEPTLSDTVAETGSVIGGKLKYQTGALYGLRVGAAFYAVEDTGLTKWEEYKKDGYNQVATGLFGDGWGSYSTLGEAYVSYRLSNTDLTYGRQEFKTPMTENAVTIIPNLFEGTVATIKEIPDFTITAAHIDKIQYGTRSTTDQGLIGDGTYGLTAGAGLGLSAPSRNVTTGVLTSGYGKQNFQDIGAATFGTGARMDTVGLTALGIDYTKGNLKVRAWDYFAHKMFNTAYGDINYKMDLGGAKVNLGTQILKQNDIGDFETTGGGTALKQVRSVSTLSGTTLYRTKLSSNGQIDALLWGVQAKADMGPVSLLAAYNQNNNGHIISAWGGDPAYTSMIFDRNEYRANTNAYKVGGDYNFGSLGIEGLKFTVQHAAYDTDVETCSSTGVFAGMQNEKSNAQDYILHYAVPSVKGLWFRVFHEERHNDTRNYDQSHTRLIANLSF